MKHALVLLPLFLATGCATAGSTAAANHNFTPVKMTSTAMPIFDRPERMHEAQFDISVDVMVDPTGHADMGTYHATGSASNTYDAALRQWLAMAQFKPATLDGIPVRGKFGAGFRSSVTINR